MFYGRLNVYFNLLSCFHEYLNEKSPLLPSVNRKITFDCKYLMFESMVYTYISSDRYKVVYATANVYIQVYLHCIFHNFRTPIIQTPMRIKFEG